MDQESIRELEREFVESLNLLKECGILFRRYEGNHLEKVKSASDREQAGRHQVKADVNNEIATRIEAFINRDVKTSQDSLITAET